MAKWPQLLLFAWLVYSLSVGNLRHGQITKYHGPLITLKLMALFCVLWLGGFWG